MFWLTLDIFVQGVGLGIAIGVVFSASPDTKSSDGDAAEQPSVGGNET